MYVDSIPFFRQRGAAHATFKHDASEKKICVDVEVDTSMCY